MRSPLRLPSLPLGLSVRSSPMSCPLPKCLAVMAAAAALAGVAGCGSTSGGSTTTNVAASDCTPGKLQTKTPGELTVATDKPAYPPYFEDDDPTNGKGFESATAYAIARPARLLALRRDMGRPSPSTRATRPARRTSTSTSTRSRSRRPAPGARRLLGAVLHREPGGRGREGLERRKRDIAGRPEGRHDRCPDRHHQPRRGQLGDPAVDPAEGLQRLQRRRHGAEGGPGGRGRGRPARPRST